MAKRGIDVSRWQGDIDWNLVRGSGCEFAILKAGGSDAGFYTDGTFERNYWNARSAGVDVGAYYFVGPRCLTEEDGIADAKRFLDIVKDWKFEYPLYLDFEAPPAGRQNECTNAAIGFCRTVEDAGYYAGIYASDISGFKERLSMKRLEAFDIWVARYGSAPDYIKHFREWYGMWQYSSTGSVPGILGNVDLDIAYYDFPAIMKSRHLNGY